MAAHLRELPLRHSAACACGLSEVELVGSAFIDEPVYYASVSLFRLWCRDFQTCAWFDSDFAACCKIGTFSTSKKPKRLAVGILHNSAFIGVAVPIPRPSRG